MEFKLNFNFPVSESKLNYSDELILFGSCFSDEMAQKLEEGGFQVYSNPFGTIFNPKVLATLILDSLSEKKEVSVLKRNDLFFSWDTSGQIFAYSEAEIKQHIIELRSAFKTKLKNASKLFVTFGTAWEYRLIETNEIVGNCHKVAASSFEKKLSSQSEMFELWKECLKQLKVFNPNLEFIFTVSPVRHLKDGLVENNRSKARLIELSHSLVEESKASYFPAYEIVLDELRDYRFFKADFAHPNADSIAYVWSSFQAHYFDKNTEKIYKEWMHLQRQLNHRSLYAESEDFKAFTVKTQKQLKVFIDKNPWFRVD